MNRFWLIVGAAGWVGGAASVLLGLWLRRVARRYPRVRRRWMDEAWSQCAGGN